MKTSLLFLAVLLLLQCRSQQYYGAPATLENTHWKLVEVGGKPVTTPEGGREVYMELTREGVNGRLNGYAGCNGLGGDYTTAGKTIRFQPITTRMYCELQMDVETGFTGMLASADHYRIRGNSLELFSAEELLGRFEAITRDQGN
ncbi:MAG: META domain-containing protein [Chryseosolibacter sp.]